MYKHNIAYRHENGKVEGFTGWGFHQAIAKRMAMKKLHAKVTEILGQTVEDNRIIESKSQATPEEMKIIQKDWEISECSQTV